MRAITLMPGKQGSARLDDLPEPPSSAGAVLVEALELGICGTDIEIVHGDYGWAPPGHERLVLGHENLGRVLDTPAGAELAVGDLVVGIVRRPDPVPCGACAVGEWDMCRNGRYTEHGIKGRHGFGRERWRAEADAVVRLDPTLSNVGVLLEPTTIVAKAWEQIERIGARAYFDPQAVAVTGAGPVGLLAALLGVQRGLDVHVFDIVTEGPKPDLVHSLGATYHTEPLSQVSLAPDITLECTGVASVVLDAITRDANDGITCLTGVSNVGHSVRLDLGGLNREVVLRNDVVFGSVNANARHYRQAAQALADADRGWLTRLITRRVPLARFAEAFQPQPEDVKVVLDLAGDSA